MAEQIDLRAQHVMGQHSRIGSIVQQRRFRLTLHPQLVHDDTLLRCSLRCRNSWFCKGISQKTTN